MALRDFILELQDKIAQHDPIVDKVKSPSALIQALQDLDDLVGMEAAKASVVSQMQYLLVCLASGHSTTSHMLHTVIYGPPGVGKTRLGVCLAKIWLAAGLFRPSQHVDPKAPRDAIKMLEETVESRDEVISQLHRHRRAHRDMVRTCRHVTGRIERVRYRTNQYRYLDRLRYIFDQLEDELSMELTVPPSPPPVEDVPFVIASAADLIAKYIGQSAPKTRAFFEAHRGGVIFIDEAYAMGADRQGGFGLESLTELNKCMSEHPDTIVQMAGYKDLMQETVFSLQPGLERRFTWVFDIPGYTPDDLEKIILYQLKQDGWSVDPTTRLRNIISQHLDSFTAFGGDTEKLCFYAKQAYAESMYALTNPTYTSTLNSSMFDLAMKRLSANRVQAKESAIPATMYM